MRGETSRRGLGASEEVVGGSEGGTEGAELEARDGMSEGGDDDLRARFGGAGASEPSLLRFELADEVVEAGVPSRATTLSVPTAGPGARLGWETRLTTRRTATVVPLPLGFDVLDLEKKLKGALIARDDARELARRSGCFRQTNLTDRRYMHFSHVTGRLR